MRQHDHILAIESYNILYNIWIQFKNIFKKLLCTVKYVNPIVVHIGTNAEIILLILFNWNSDLPPSVILI